MDDIEGLTKDLQDLETLLIKAQRDHSKSILSTEISILK